VAQGSVTLVPGVNSERTPTLLRAGISTSSLIRFRDSLVQKYGGWQKYYQFAIGGIPRDLHAWQDLNENLHLSVGTTTQLNVITNGTTLADISPQQLVSNFVPNISTTANSTVVSIIDPNISNVTVNDSVFFNVPVSIGGLILDGLYPITEVTGTHSYNITVPVAATTTATNPTATNGTTASGNNTLHFGTTPAWLTQAFSIYDLTTPAAIPSATIVSSTTGTTVVMSQPAAGAGVGNGDSIVFAGVPVFTTTNGSTTVNVAFPAHGLSVGSIVVFPVSTTGQGVTISGSYDAVTIIDPNNFSITAGTQATGSGTFAMNGGNAQLVYNITLGPPPLGAGYGTGTYGTGGYGTGSGTTDQTGTKIAASDWTSDNWGEIGIFCPANGGIYFWDPTGGLVNASLITQAPPINSGIFVSTSEQIMMAYGSSVHQAIGWQQQPLLINWCDVSNFFQWDATAADQAGDFVIPIGSKIQAGLAVSNQNLFFTDLDLWAGAYIGPPDVFGFNKIGSGMGAVSRHCVQQLRGSVYWMSQTNFNSYTSNGANVMPCDVWDAVFQNINTNFLENVRSLPSTPYNEVGWAFPSAASTSGECDSYVKVNITEPNAPWDYGIGVMPRSAWIDQSVLGMPIGATPTGVIYQHETSPDADGAPLVPSFTTGYFYLAEGEDYVLVDQIIPDFRWTSFNGGTSAQIQLYFNLLNYPGDTVRTYGPFTVMQSTEYIWLRQRGRLMSITITSSDIGSFWRIGSCKYRYQSAGRR
jgi:hypothetical protein